MTNLTTAQKSKLTRLNNQYLEGKMSCSDNIAARLALLASFGLPA